MIELFLDRRSGVSPYLQLVQQVKRAMLLGALEVGDQLPTVKEVVSKLAINPNTVLKAYRALEHEGLIESRPGIGTFVIQTLDAPMLELHPYLRDSLLEWIRTARDSGLDEESIAALFDSARREDLVEESV